MSPADKDAGLHDVGAYDVGAYDVGAYVDGDNTVKPKPTDDESSAGDTPTKKAER